MDDKILADIMAQFKKQEKIKLSKLSLIFPLIKKNKKYIFFAFVLLLVLSLLSLPVPLIMQSCVDSLVSGKVIFKKFALSVLAIFGLYILKFIFSLVLQFFTTSHTEKILIEVKQNVFNLLIRSNICFLNQNKVGYITKRIDEVDGIRVLFSPMILKQLVSVFEFFFALFILFTLSWQIAIISLFLLIPFYFITKKSSEGMFNSSKDVFEKSAEVSGSFTDNISGTETIKNAGAEDIVLESMSQKYNAYRKKAIVQSILLSAFSEITFLLNSVSTLIIFFVSGVFIMKGSMTIGLYLAVVSYFGKLLVPVVGSTSLGMTLIPAITALERLEEFFSLKYEGESFSATNELKQLKSVVFSNVAFSYSEDKRIFDNLNLSISNNEKILILGNNGTGKTTVSRLLLGHLLPVSGEISINGKPYQSYTLASLRKKIGIANQQVFLFNDTIMYNIALSHELKDESHVHKLIEKIGLQEYFTVSFPNGLRTEVGENGIMLSGGQKQIVAILRMLFFDAELFILDESFSNIDDINRKHIIDYFNMEKKCAKIIYMSPVENTFFDYKKIIHL